MERRREAPDEGPDAVRRAELAAEVRAERRLAEGARARARGARGAGRPLQARIARDGRWPSGRRAAAALDRARDAVAGAARAGGRAGAGRRGRRGHRGRAARVRPRGGRDPGAAAKAGERVTEVEVAAQQVRDGAAEAEAALPEVAGRLGLEAEPGRGGARASGARSWRARIERLLRRREQLGPVNPLAAKEYEEAVAHVEELEGQRKDLEGALAELRA